MTALTLQIRDATNGALLAVAVVLLALAAWITVEAVLSLWRGRPGGAASAR
jgi:hypothetical protein